MENEVVDFLRERAEEDDLNSVLKISMGRYTKKSVQDYVAQLKKEQQAVNKRFNDDIQKVLEEKEELKKELDRQKAMVIQSETQYRALAESLEEFKAVEGEITAEDILKMKKQIAKLEDAISVLEAKNKAEVQRQEQLRAQLESKEVELGISIQAQKVTSELLQVEKEKRLQSLKEVKEMSQNLTLAQNELTFLREQLSEGEVNRLKEQINTLSVELKTQEELLGQRKGELEAKESQAAVQEEQIIMLQKKSEQLQQTVEAVTLQNKKYEAYQKELSEKLHTVFAENLELLNAKSEVQLQNIILSRKLDELNCNMALEKVRTEV